MSLRSEKVRSFLGMNLNDLTDDKLKELSSEILKSKIHGICFISHPLMNREKLK